MDISKLKNILEAILLGADRALSVIQLEALFELDEERPTRDEIRKALHEMADDYVSRGYELKQVASGYRLQVKQEYATWVGRLWEEKPARYTRALLETMALIAYRQPVTRGEIEEVRGVSVSSNIIKTLLERDWIKVLGHKDVPGKPTLYGTTKAFLDYFNLKKLDQLPTLAEIKDLDSIHPELELDDNAQTHAENSDETDVDDSGSGEPGTDSLDAENSVTEKSEATENSVDTEPAAEESEISLNEERGADDEPASENMSESQSEELSEEIEATEKQAFNV